MNILSLFDGISALQLSLNNIGIKYDTYYASEIDKNCIKITNKNYPCTIQLGDVKLLSYENIDDVFILGGGSPCVDLSIAGRGYERTNKGLLGERSSLFFNYLDALYSTNPKYFLFENVSSMKDEDKTIITRELGVEPVRINSSKFSAQLRDRLYWTNINIDIDKLNEINSSLVIQDILLETYDDRYLVSEKAKAGKIKSKVSSRKPRDINKKSRALITHGDVVCVIQDGIWRNLTPIEYERLQTFPDNYTAGVANTHRYKSLGNSWTIKVIDYILSGIKDE